MKLLSAVKTIATAAVVATVLEHRKDLERRVKNGVDAVVSGAKKRLSQ